VSEIFLLALEKNDETVIAYLLYQSGLAKAILDTSRDAGLFTFSHSGKTVNKGFLAFTRRLANKLIDLGANGKNEEAQNFLESIPEWQEYKETVLDVMNDIESKPLAQDPRSKTNDDVGNDDFLDILGKFKDVHRSGYHNKNKDETTDSKDENFYGDSIMNQRLGARRANYQVQQDEEEEEEDFGRLEYEDDRPQEVDLNDYFSNGNGDKGPWGDTDFVDYDMTKLEDGEPLSLHDLVLPK
jgi:hypothetical protein